MEGGSNSGKKPQSHCQVFLSFRECDTQYGFADCLYHFLKDAGVRVFRDYEEFRQGDKMKEVLTMINKCIVCIPILSQNYANSNQCLSELAEMVKHNKVIMPIFYKVEAKDVKLETKLYSDHLSKLGDEYDTKKVEWESALKKVARVKAFPVTDKTGYGELCKQVVSDVLSKLKIVEVKHKILDGQPIGIDGPVDALLKLLHIGPSRVRCVVIHGEGGIGKTTLAKAVFNQLFGSRGGFERYCFLSNVRETTKYHGILHVQNMLLRQLGTREMDIYDGDLGIKTIKDVVKNKKVLIVLDDLDHRNQIKNLAGDLTWFGSGSRIIITTRNLTWVPKHLGAREYPMSEMQSDQALQLFCRHAFKMESPPDAHLDISKEVVTACGSVPLVLEVMGSYLHQIDKNHWKSKTEMIDSHNNVQEKLMISFEALDPRTKEIFLDIACFFAGKKRSYAEDMWEACNFRVDKGIECLLSKSLVKICEDGTLWMHDVLRDLGRLQKNYHLPTANIHQ